MNDEFMLKYEKKAAILAAAIAAGGPLAAGSVVIHLLATAQINPDKSGLLSQTQPGNGLDASKPVTQWSSVSRATDGSVFVTSNMLTWLPTAAPVSEVVTGIAITSDPDINTLFAYAAFDHTQPVQFPNQPVSVILELGFNGTDFYVWARRIPLGE